MRHSAIPVFLAVMSASGAAQTSPDPDLQRYVTSVGRRLARSAPVPNLRVSFVLYDDTALAPPLSGNRPPEPIGGAPNGAIAVSLSFFRNTATESEFAAGLAHAIAHVMLRHRSAASLVRPIPPADPRLQTLQPRYPVYSLRQEQQADIAAAGLLAGAGYDASALRAMVAKLPRPQDRLRAVEQALAALPPYTQRPESREFDEWKGSAGGGGVAL